MAKWTRTTSLLFLAAMSVYPVGALLGAPEKKATEAGSAKSTDVSLLDETAGPVAETETKTVESTKAPEAKVEAKSETKVTEAKPVDATEAKPADKAKPSDGTSVGNQQVNVSDAGTVEIHVNDANLVEVLRMLSLQSQKNIIASKDVRGTVTANLYNVTIREALDAILKANGYGYQEKGNFIYVYTQKELEEREKRERQPVTEVFHLYYTPAANAVNMLKPVMSAEGQVSFTVAAAMGIESGGKDAGGNSHATEDIIVVKDMPENMEKVRKVLKEIDRRPQQVLVESTIVASKLTEDNALGIDFAIVGGVDFSGITAVGAKTSDVLSGKVLEGGPGKDAATALNDKNNLGGASTGFTQNVKSGGLRMGVITNNVGVFLSALDEVSDSYVLANPKVLTLNKQRGEVLVGSEDGYLTTTVTESTAVQSVQFLQTGTRLVFRPYIGDDGYIRMEVHPEASTGQVISGLPSKQTTEVTTNIMVKDGHTVVIGGLFRDKSTIGRSQIPGLGNLPLVGPLFRSQNDSTVREEIIILLTPHIVKDDAKYAQQSEEAMKDMEKLRVGVRREMMFFGRERLAEANYDNAVAEMNKPHPDMKKALWYLDSATNLNPTFLEAIRMKEELSGKVLTTADNSSVRGFVRRLVMSERSAARAEADVTQSNALTAPPTTQPVADAEDAPVEPIAEAEPTVAPTTQPVAEAPTTRPVNEPAVAENSKPQSETSENKPVADASSEKAPADKTATKPVEEPKTTVTEVPSEDATDEPLPGDDK